MPSKAEEENVSIKVGINGMGRIGRANLRYSLQHPDIEVVAVNDITDGQSSGVRWRRRIRR